MGFRLVPNSVTLNGLERRNGRYNVTLCYFIEFVKPAFQHNHFRAQERKLTFAISSADELLVRITQHITGHFRDGSFQAIDCTGTDDRTQRNKRTRTPETQKVKCKNTPEEQHKSTKPWFSRHSLHAARKRSGPNLIIPESGTGCIQKVALR